MSLITNKIEYYLVEKESDDNFVIKYQFSDIYDNKYLVQFKNDTNGPGKSRLGISYELTYFVWDNDLNDWSINKIINTNIYILMNTIFGKIVTSFLRERNWVRKVRFEGLAKETERDFITQRTKLYVRHLTNNPIEEYKLENYGNRINLVKIIK